MDETRVQIGEDVILDLGTNSEWCICMVSWDGHTISIELRRKDEYEGRRIIPGFTSLKGE